MEESILTSVKALLGFTEEYEAYDKELIMHINTVLMILTQLGIGPSEGFSIHSKEVTWSDFLGSELAKLEGVKSYVGQRVRLMFDPPTSSTVMESMDRTIKELEYRLYITENPKTTFEGH